MNKLGNDLFFRPSNAKKESLEHVTKSMEANVNNEIQRTKTRWDKLTSAGEKHAGLEELANSGEIIKEQCNSVK